MSHHCDFCGDGLLWVTTLRKVRVPLSLASRRWLQVGAGDESGIEPTHGIMLRGSLVTDATARELDEAERCVTATGATGIQYRYHPTTQGVFIEVYSNHLAECAARRRRAP